MDLPSSLREPCDYLIYESDKTCGNDSEVFGVEGRNAVARCAEHDFMAPWAETTWEEYLVAKVMFS